MTGVKFQFKKLAESLSSCPSALKDFKENWTTMKSNFENLKSALAEVQSVIAQYADAYHTPTDQVKYWILNATVTISEYDTLRSKIDAAHFGLLTKLKYSFQLRKLTLQSAKLAREQPTQADTVLFTEVFHAIPNLPYKPSIGNDMIVEELWDCLKLDAVKLFGLHGEAGIGKTTILLKLHNKLERDILGFDVVIYVQVQVLTSGFINRSHIVDAIGRRVLIIVEKPRITETLEEKIRLIFDVLSHMKFILILDGLPHFIDLERVGVPNLQANGSKVLFSCEQMQADRKFKVEAFRAEYAWKLFCSNLYNVSLADPNICNLAIEIHANCNGVPGKLVETAFEVASATTLDEWKMYLESKFGKKRINLVDENVS